MLFEFENIQQKTSEFGHFHLKKSALKAEIQSFRDLEKIIPIIDFTSDIDFINFGKFSNIHLLEHLLKFTGNADVLLTSWSISDFGIKRLISLKNDGIIKDLKCLFDVRTLKFNPNVAELANFNIDAKFINIHAKLMILKGENGSLCVMTSSNLNENKRIEVGTIIVDTERINFFANQLNFIIDEAN
jgi:hypothetical protein